MTALAFILAVSNVGWAALWVRSNRIAWAERIARRIADETLTDTQVELSRLALFHDWAIEDLGQRCLAALDVHGEASVRPVQRLEATGRTASAGEAM